MVKTIYRCATCNGVYDFYHDAKKCESRAPLVFNVPIGSVFTLAGRVISEERNPGIGFFFDKPYLVVRKNNPDLLIGHYSTVGTLALSRDWGNSPLSNKILCPPAFSVEDLREIDARAFNELNLGLRVLPEDYIRTMLVNYGLDFKKLRRGLKQDIEPRRALVPGSREHIQMQLERAVEEEAYERASALRDQLASLRER